MAIGENDPWLSGMIVEFGDKLIRREFVRIYQKLPTFSFEYVFLALRIAF